MYKVQLIVTTDDNEMTFVQEGKGRSPFGPLGAVGRVVKAYVMMADTAGLGGAVAEVEKLAAMADALGLSPDDDCTHGADCKVHPGVNQIHNFDRAR